MYTSYHKRKSCLLTKTISLCLVFIFSFSFITPPPAYAQAVVPAGNILNLPNPGSMIPLSHSFVPTTIKGVKVYPDDPLRFDFIIDTGDADLQGSELEKESTKLIRYFLTALTVPEDDLWVNLSPYEKDRIVPEEFGQTEMGRDLLAQDYILKQITSSLMYPEDAIGQKFWERVYKRAFDLYGTTDIPVNTFNKVWIIPKKAAVYSNGDTVFVTKNTLKVMLERDYLATKEARRITKDEIGEDSSHVSHLASDVIKQVIIPELEREVNEGKNFAPLRQIYTSLILATWFKQNLKESLLGKVYFGQRKIEGVDIEDKQVKDKIYQQYLEAFKSGVYNFVKEEYDPNDDEVIPRKYFSGGADLGFGDAGVAVDPVSEVSYNGGVLAAVNLQAHGDSGLIARGDAGVAPTYLPAVEGYHFKPELSFDHGAPLSRNDIEKIQQRVRYHNKSVRRILQLTQISGIELSITGHLRGVDGPGSSLDLPDFQRLLTDKGIRGLDQLPSTPTIASDFKAAVKFELTDDPDEIVYIAPDYGWTEENPFRSTEEVQLDENGKAPNKELDAVNYIFRNIFGISGIKVTMEAIPPMAKAGGMESSNVFYTALISAASILTGVNLSTAEIFALAVKLENDEFSGITGGQGHLATLLGGAYHHRWLSGVRGADGKLVNPYSALSSSLLSDDKLDSIEEHMALVQAGKEYENGKARDHRESTLINIMWTDLLKDVDPVGLPLHREKLGLTKKYTDALKAGDFKTAADAAIRYVEIREDLVIRWLNLMMDARNNVEDTPEYAKDYARRVFELPENHPDYKVFKVARDIFDQQGEDALREARLYTHGAAADLVDAAKKEGIAVMPLGAGGPGANLVAIHPDGQEALREFLKRQGILEFDENEARKIIRGVDNEGQPFEGVHTLKGFMPLKVGRETMKFNGFGKMWELRHPSLPAIERVEEKDIGLIKELPIIHRIVNSKLEEDYIGKSMNRFISFWKFDDAKGDLLIKDGTEDRLPDDSTYKIVDRLLDDILAVGYEGRIVKVKEVSEDGLITRVGLEMPEFRDLTTVEQRALRGITLQILKRGIEKFLKDKRKDIVKPLEPNRDGPKGDAGLAVDTLKEARADIQPLAQRLVDFLADANDNQHGIVDWPSFSREEADSHNPVIHAVGSPAPESFYNAAERWKQYKQWISEARGEEVNVPVVITNGIGRGFRNLVKNTFTFLKEKRNTIWDNDQKNDFDRKVKDFKAKFAEDIEALKLDENLDAQADEKLFKKVAGDYQEIVEANDGQDPDDRLNEAQVIKFLFEMNGVPEVDANGKRIIFLEQQSNNTYANMAKGYDVIKNAIAEAYGEDTRQVKIHVIADGFHRLRTALTAIGYLREFKGENWEINADATYKPEFKNMNDDQLYAYLEHMIGDPDATGGINGEIGRINTYDIPRDGPKLYEFARNPDEFRKLLDEWDPATADDLRTNLLKKYRDARQYAVIRDIPEKSITLSVGESLSNPNIYDIEVRGLTAATPSDFKVKKSILRRDSDVNTVADLLTEEIIRLLPSAPLNNLRMLEAKLESAISSISGGGLLDDGLRSNTVVVDERIEQFVGEADFDKSPRLIISDLDGTLVEGELSDEVRDELIKYFRAGGYLALVTGTSYVKDNGKGTDKIFVEQFPADVRKNMLIYTSNGGELRTYDQDGKVDEHVRNGLPSAMREKIRDVAVVVGEEMSFDKPRLEAETTQPGELPTKMTFYLRGTKQSLDAELVNRTALLFAEPLSKEAPKIKVRPNPEDGTVQFTLESKMTSAEDSVVRVASMTGQPVDPKNVFVMADGYGKDSTTDLGMALAVPKATALNFGKPVEGLGVDIINVGERQSQEALDVLKKITGQIQVKTKKGDAGKAQPAYYLTKVGVSVRVAYKLVEEIEKVLIEEQPDGNWRKVRWTRAQLTENVRTALKTLQEKDKWDQNLQSLGDRQIPALARYVKESFQLTIVAKKAVSDGDAGKAPGQSEPEDIDVPGSESFALLLASARHGVNDLSTSVQRDMLRDRIRGAEEIIRKQPSMYEIFDEDGITRIRLNEETIRAFAFLIWTRKEGFLSNIEEVPSQVSVLAYTRAFENLLEKALRAAWVMREMTPFIGESEFTIPKAKLVAHAFADFNLHEDFRFLNWAQSQQAMEYTQQYIDPESLDSHIPLSAREKTFDDMMQMARDDRRVYANSKIGLSKIQKMQSEAKKEFTPFLEKLKAGADSSGDDLGDAGKAPGGIDLNPAQFELESEGQQIQFDIPAEFQDLENIPINGFTPVIFSITPVTNFPLLLGIKEEEGEEEQLSKAI